MFYHASPVGGIEVLQPEISNHNEPLLYFSEKRENVLVYLSNAIEKLCRQTGFIHNGKWRTWASYGFDADGRLQLDEYYPDAIEDTYKGMSGYIYAADSVEERKDIRILHAFATSSPVTVCGVEYVEDAFAEILKAEKAGLIRIRRYAQHDQKMLQWIEKTIRAEYAATTAPDYRYFLQEKFAFIEDA